MIFASMYTLGGKRVTLDCWSDDLLVEADEEDLDAVEAHLMKRLEVKVLAQIGGKSPGEAGFLKRVLRHDAVTESFFVCCGKCYVQDAAAALQLRGQDGRHTWHEWHRCNTVRGRTRISTRAKQLLSDAPAFRGARGSVMYVALDRRSCTPPRRCQRSCNLQRCRRWPSSSGRCAIC